MAVLTAAFGNILLVIFGELPYFLFINFQLEVCVNVAMCLVNIYDVVRNLWCQIIVIVLNAPCTPV